MLTNMRNMKNNLVTVLLLQALPGAGYKIRTLLVVCDEAHLMLILPCRGWHEYNFGFPNALLEALRFVDVRANPPVNC